jgi:hypothetical protein
MATPLYKGLKQNSGQTTYIFPSVSEDISLSNQNDNYKMNFSKFMLLKLDLTQADSNFVNKEVFPTESPAQTSMINGDLLVNQLRNYVANQDVTIRQSLINNTTNFYDPLAPLTVTERIFWKWMRKSGLVQFDPATPNVDYIDKTSFSVDSTLDPSYFKEYLWKERERKVFNIDFQNGKPTNQANDSALFVYNIYVKDSTNFKDNDNVQIVIDKTIYNATVLNVSSNEIYFNNLLTIQSTVKLDFIPSPTKKNTIELDYNRTIQYVGEINAVNNVVSADKSYTEVTAYIPDMNGQTPLILFRIKSDTNYSASLQYPILPSQQQPEIIGSEQFDSPINLQPQNYPGDKYAYFDSEQQTYLNSTGLTNQRSGDFYGVKVADNSRYSINYVGYPFLDGSNIDGVTTDFDYTDYSGMNIPNNVYKTFDEYSSAISNSVSPKDFEFNAVLWYYDIYDTNTKATTTNLYGITFVSSIDNTLSSPNLGVLPKYVSDNTKDGISYIFNLNLNFNINTEQLPEKFDSDKVFSMFGFDKYNAVINNINQTNNVYDQIAAGVIRNTQDISNIKSLVYNNATIQALQAQITSMNNLINLYQRTQIGDSDTITTYLDNSVSPALLRLNDISTTYSKIYNFNTSSLYNTSTNAVLYNKIVVPAKDFLTNIINDDTNSNILSDNLTVVLDKDLKLNQTAYFSVSSITTASTFKRLNINIADSSDLTKGKNIIPNIELPVKSNLDTAFTKPHISSRINSEIYISDITIKKSTNQYFFTLMVGDIAKNNLMKGDVIYINNFKISYTVNNVTYSSDLSGQYLMNDDSLIFVVTDNTIIKMVQNSVTSLSSYLVAVPTIRVINKHIISVTKTTNTDYLINIDTK